MVEIRQVLLKYNISLYVHNTFGCSQANKCTTADKVIGRGLKYWNICCIQTHHGKVSILISYIKCAALFHYCTWIQNQGKQDFSWNLLPKNV